MNVEVAVILAIILFVVGGCYLIYYNQITKVSVILMALSLGLGFWIFGAATSDRLCVDVSYHTIFQHELEDGTLVDVIFVTDDNGNSRMVNLNVSLGVTVPDDGFNYKVARVKYAQKTWGLSFNPSPRYKIVSD